MCGCECLCICLCVCVFVSSVILAVFSSYDVHDTIPNCPSFSRFSKACETAQLVNIYGSTEVGADVCYAVLSPPTLDTHHPPTRPFSHTYRDLITRALSSSNKSDVLSIPQGIMTSDLKSSKVIAEPDNYSSSLRTDWLLGNAPIGYPIDGNELFIARIKRTNNNYLEDPDSSVEINAEDLEFELVADGEPGELFVGGSQLAMGYHNRPKETAERFVSRKAIIGIDSISLTTGKREQEQDDKDEGEGEAVYHHSLLEGAINTEKDFADCPRNRGNLFRTGDIVVRIPIGTQARTPPHSTMTDMTSSRMEDDGQEGGERCRRGKGIGCDEVCEEGNDDVKIGMLERRMENWAGAIVWLGRRDLQVPCHRMTFSILPYAL